MKRIERLRAKLAEQDLDAMFVSQPENRRYMSGFTGSAGYLIISHKEAVLATDFRYTEQAGLQAPDYRVIQVAGDMSKWLPDVLAAGGVRRIAFDADHVSYNFFQLLTKATGESGVTWAPTSGVVEYLRAIKEPEEIAAVERAQALTDAAFLHVTQHVLHPGMTEAQLAWELEKYIREHGGDGLAFDTIIAAGPNGARPHHRAGSTVIEEGQPIVIDMGAKVDGYCADMTRTIVLGQPDDTFKKIYDIVLGAQLLAEELIRTGQTGHQADAFARDLIDQAGYGETFGHSLGHGIGLYVHEYPRLSKGATNILEDNMIFSVEPGIYLTGWGGVRIEDLVVLENGSARVITRSPKAAP
ncbi:MAG: aminopeptidase P family protein [Chloroflexi bacterium]|nr:aminopeptidase P family protein [Chloroflexota bacterium]